MVSVDQKQNALEKAVVIAEKYARGGGDRMPSQIIRDSYNQIIEITDEIYKEKD